MANSIPEYFLARNWDYPPDGPIKIGNVISSLKTPHRPLARLVPEAENGDSIDAFDSTKFDVAMEDEREKHGGLSVLTTWLSGLLGLGVDVGFDTKSSSDRSFTFKRVDTRGFTPTDRYNERCANAPKVRRFLERSWFRKRIFVITGIKVVSGARASTTKSQSTDVITGAQVDGTLLSGGMVPVGGGPEVRGGRTKRNRIAWKGSTDFVLAFRVSEIVVNRKGDVEENEYLKGAKLGLEDDAVKKDSEQLIVATSDRPIDSKGFEPVVVLEGDEPVHYGIPEDSDDEEENED